MELKTEIKGNIVSYKWDKPLKDFKGRKLYLKYDVDISETPLHVANFIFGVFMQDGITLSGRSLSVNELTQKEVIGLQKTFDMNYESHGCAGKVRGYNMIRKPRILAHRLVNNSSLDGDGPVICANGMGKDGMNVALIVKELGYDGRSFILSNAYKEIRRGLWRERINTTKKFYREAGLKGNIVETNFFRKKGDRMGFYPYVAGIPLAYHYDSNVILDGIQLHNNKTSIVDGSFYCPGETIFAFNHVSKATGITVSSPIRALSNFGAQKLLAKRWPHFLKYQRSCMYGNPWCGKCAKCNRKALYLQALGIDPRRFRLPKYRESRLALHEYGPVQDSVIQVLAKYHGHEYNIWINGANKYALDSIWEGKAIRDILQEYFYIYMEDPGPDGEGYTLNPSKWRGWLNE